MDLPDLHAERWPWCPYGTAPHSHSEDMGTGSKIDGHRAGPMWLMRNQRAESLTLEPVPNPVLHLGDPVFVHAPDGRSWTLHVTGVREDGSAHLGAQQPTDG